jgi:N-acetyl-gamma-glutamylphosphate reductase
MGKTAILLGASGLTGSCLLQELLNSKSYNTIHCIGRTPLGVSHPKLKQHIHNLLELNFTTLNISADVVFCCIGTTQAKTPDKARLQKN